MKPYDTIILKQDELVSLGVNLDAMGITNRKNRPYVIIAMNRQMTWLAPLTTVMKHGHGRVVVSHYQKNGNNVECELITTDMFSLSTKIVDACGIYRGKIAHSSKRAVIDQLVYSVACGSLGRPVR